LSAKRREDHRTFLVGLTAAAGALDALTFLHLGKVFSSFQSGNVLFLGLGAGSGDWGLVVRAGAVLTAFVVGAMAGSRLTGGRILGTEAVVLAIFGLAWIVVATPADHPVARVVLLALAAGAMGLQAAYALALKIPNVVTVALTATVATLGERAGDAGQARDPSQPSNRFLLTLCAAYALCAIAIAVLPDTSTLSLAPLALLASAVALDRLNAALPSPSRGTYAQGARN